MTVFDKNPIADPNSASSKLRRIAFAIAATILSMFPATSNSQPTLGPDALFALNVCNRTNTTINVTIMHADPLIADNWILSGWFGVLGGECKKVGEYPRGYIYLHANQQNGRLQWGGTDKYICVSDRPVRRTVFPNERCLAGEANRGFVERLVKDAEYSWNLGR